MEINRNNYETFFLLYLDRELNPREMSEVEKFVNENADLQKEFSLLRQTILIPVQTEYDQKELLYRKEEKRKIIPIYWSRIAAAVAVLVLGGWLMKAQLEGKQESGTAKSDNRKNIMPAKKNNSDQKIQSSKSNMSDLSNAALNKIQPSDQKNIANTKHEPAQNSGIVKNRISRVNDLSVKNKQVQPLVSSNTGLQNPSSVEEPDGSNLAMQKSSVQGLQPVDARNETNPKQMAAPPDSHSPGLLIASTGAAENVPHVRDENAVSDNEDQTDNAISVVALNDKNKGITKLFKKLTKRTLADENARKVRVSVFQFGY